MNRRFKGGYNQVRNENHLDLISSSLPKKEKYYGLDAQK